ncbi:MAG: tetratricopeptide repeat protein, partial [Methylococcaceae bacterium]
MHPTFIGRERQLAEIDRLIKAKQGGVFAVKGNPGIGKSTLLRHIAKQYNDKGQVFIDLNDLRPLQTAVEFLQFFTERAHGLKYTQEALAKINGTYKTVADLAAPYQSVLTDAGQLAADELSKNLDGQDKSKLSGIASILWKLGIVLWGRKQENDKTKLGDPELYLLKALKQDCKQHPLIFIDTYERLQAASEISQQKISSRYSRPHEHLDPKNESISLQDWLERFLPFLQQQGAIIMIAGRKTGYWQALADSLERFEEDDILALALALAGSSQYAYLQQAVAEQPQAVLSVLKQLSFDGIPLWLQLAINFVGQELDNGKTISELAVMDNLNAYFAIPVSDADLNTDNIEHASCKLALFKRVMQHNLEIADHAWQMALPRRLDKSVLKVLFAEQAETMRNAFVNAGLMLATRIVSDEQDFRLHNEIRDLLLAYARYKKWLEADESKGLHKKLADVYNQRYQRQSQAQWLLERLYHQLMLEDDADLGPINEPQLLITMAIDLQAEKQYTKMSQVFLRLIDIQPNYEDAWFGLGVALGQQGKLDEAVAAYRKQIEIKPDHDSAWNNLGNALGQQGKLDEAVAAYRKQIEIKPDDDSAWNNLGNALSEQGKLDEAVAAYRKQIEIKPDDDSAWYNLGIALSEQGKLDEAVAAYRKQIEIKPDHDSAWNNLGNALGQQGKL